MTRVRYIFEIPPLPIAPCKSLASRGLQSTSSAVCYRYCVRACLNCRYLKSCVRCRLNSACRDMYDFTVPSSMTSPSKDMPILSHPRKSLKPATCASQVPSYNGVIAVSHLLKSIRLRAPLHAAMTTRVTSGIPSDTGSPYNRPITPFNPNDWSSLVYVESDHPRSSNHLLPLGVLPSSTIGCQSWPFLPQMLIRGFWRMRFVAAYSPIQSLAAWH
mgnify:CR=1 FL=1